MNTLPDFTTEYFDSEITNFRQLCGNKEFMHNEDKQDAAIKGLSFVYFNTLSKNKDEEEKIKYKFKAAMDNYNQRKAFMVKLLLRKLA